MNIALLGCGKTGREIESVAIIRGHSIIGRYSSQHPLTEAGLTALQTQGAQCCIDFSTASAVLPHILLSVQARIPIVVGTTGWHEHFAHISSFVGQHEGALVHASNFSVGAHVYFKIIKEAARLLNAYPDYDAAIHETHHRMKKDAPSGTARTMADVLIAGLERKRTLRTDAAATGTPIAPDELCVSSMRVGNVFGTHTAAFSSEFDDIELTHRAHNRKGFALGAVLAAEWVQGKHGVFTAEDVFFG